MNEVTTASPTADPTTSTDNHPTRTEQLTHLTAALLSGADTALDLLTHTYDAAEMLREVGAAPTALEKKLGQPAGSQMQAEINAEEIGGKLLDLARPYVSELGELLESEGQRPAADALRWRLAWLEDNLDRNPLHFPHPVPVTGAYPTAEGVTFAPHGNTFPLSAVYRVRPKGNAFRLHILDIDDVGDEETLESYTLAPDVLAMLCVLVEVRGEPRTLAPTFRMFPPLFLSVTADGEALTLWGADEPPEPFRLNKSAAFALPAVAGGLQTVTVYQLEETGEDERPLEVAPVLMGYLTEQGLSQLEQVAAGRMVKGDAHTPEATVMLQARRLAWGEHLAKPLSFAELRAKRDAEGETEPRNLEPERGDVN